MASSIAFLHPRNSILLRWVIWCFVLLPACSLIKTGEPVQDSSVVEIPYLDLAIEEVDQEDIPDLGIPGCILPDLPPFGWKEVDSGLVDIRTIEEYWIKVNSLYQEGYRNYLDDRMEFPDIYQSTPEMSYDQFFTICNVFPEVDFSQFSVLGNHASGTGCTVAFEKHIFRDDQDRTITYELSIIEEGACEQISYNRNLILVPRIPVEYQVLFQESKQ